SLFIQYYRLQCHQKYLAEEELVNILYNVDSGITTKRGRINLFTREPMTSIMFSTSDENNRSGFIAENSGSPVIGRLT
ncbi:hypothetical protein L9F63_016289, partial [Diploptera punctata]